MWIAPIGFLLFSIFFCLSAIHIYWGAGGKRFADRAAPTKDNGQKVLNPKPVHCFVVAAGLLGCGLFILITSKVIAVELPKWLTKNGVWALSILFILRAIGEFNYTGFLKKVKSTAFGKADTKYYSPLCLLIGILLMILASLE